MVRRWVWIIRVAFLLAAVGLFAAAVQARRDSDDGPPPARELSGLTGERQAITFVVDADGRVDSFRTRVLVQCPSGSDWGFGWSPSNGAPVPFVRRSDAITIREASTQAYANGARGRGVTTMAVTLGEHGVEGYLRARWRFSHRGGHREVCDSGYVPVSAGRGARPLDRLPVVAEPWTLYPRTPRPGTVSGTQRAFAAWVDWTCARTSRAGHLQERRAIGRRYRPATDWVPWRRAYVAWHADEVRSLARLGLPRRNAGLYRRWLRNMARRVALERRELAGWRAGDLAAAGTLAARISTMKAEANADGIRFGLRTCVGNGPTGAPVYP